MKLRWPWKVRTAPTSVDESDESDGDEHRRPPTSSPRHSATVEPLYRWPPTPLRPCRGDGNDDLSGRCCWRPPPDARNEMLAVAGKTGWKATPWADVVSENRRRRLSPAQRTQSDRSLSTAAADRHRSTSGQQCATTTMMTQRRSLKLHRSCTDHVTEGSAAAGSAARRRLGEDGGESTGIWATDDDEDDDGDDEKINRKCKSITNIWKGDDFSKMLSGSGGGGGFFPSAADTNFRVGAVRDESIRNEPEWTRDDGATSRQLAVMPSRQSRPSKASLRSSRVSVPSAAPSRTSAGPSRISAAPSRTSEALSRTSAAPVRASATPSRVSAKQSHASKASRMSSVTSQHLQGRRL